MRVSLHGKNSGKGARRRPKVRTIALRICWDTQSSNEQVEAFRTIDQPTVIWTTKCAIGLLKTVMTQGSIAYLWTCANCCKGTELIHLPSWNGSGTNMSSHPHNDFCTVEQKQSSSKQVWLPMSCGYGVIYWNDHLMRGLQQCDVRSSGMCIDNVC